LETLLCLKWPYTGSDVDRSSTELIKLLRAMNHPELQQRSQFLQSVTRVLQSHIALLTSSSSSAATTTTMAGGEYMLPLGSGLVESFSPSYGYGRNDDREGSSLFPSRANGPLPAPMETSSRKAPISLNYEKKTIPSTSLKSTRSDEDTDTEMNTTDTENEEGSSLNKMSRRKARRLSKTSGATTPTTDLVPVPGELNPLKHSILKTSLLIDTRFRENVYTTGSSNFMMTLPTKFKNVVSMQLTGIEFPVAFYSLSNNYGNNYLNLTVKMKSSIDAADSTAQSTNKIFIIPDGNYTATDLIKNLNTYLQEDVLSPFQHLAFSIDISSNGSGSGKVSLKPTGDSAALITEVIMDFTRDIYGNSDGAPLTTKIGWNLGFIQPYYSGASSYTADTIPDTVGIRYFYLVVDDFQRSANDGFITAFNKNVILQNNVIARIPINGSYFDLMIENDANKLTFVRKYFGPVEISRLKVQVLDDHGRVLNMNNANFSFCLELSILYEGMPRE
jgi:hypothetical protein